MMRSDRNVSQNTRMKTSVFAVFFIFILFTAGIPETFAAEFDGFDITFGVEGGFQTSTFDYFPAPAYGGWDKSEYSAYPPYFFTGLAEALLSYQFNDTYGGLSAFISRGFPTFGEYDLVNSNDNGQSSSFSAGNFELADLVFGAVLEAGFSRSAQNWIFALSGRYAGTTYSDATFHFGSGLGLAYRIATSDFTSLNKEGLGYYGHFRLQALIFGPFGVQLSARFLLASLSFEPPWATMGASFGVFAKL